MDVPLTLFNCKYDQEGHLLRTPRPIAQKHLEIFHVIRLDREEKLREPYGDVHKIISCDFGSALIEGEFSCFGKQGLIILVKSIIVSYKGSEGRGWLKRNT